MDLQSVLLSPRIAALAVYYKQKLKLHNFTIYRLNDGKVDLYVWHEGEGGVTSNEFVSCIVSYLNSLPDNVRRVITISDGCGYQNRNKTLSSALSDFAREKSMTVEQLILERGHTMMEADSVHSTLEQVKLKVLIAVTFDSILHIIMIKCEAILFIIAADKQVQSLR